MPGVALRRARDLRERRRERCGESRALLISAPRGARQARLRGAARLRQPGDLRLCGGRGRPRGRHPTLCRAERVAEHVRCRRARRNGLGGNVVEARTPRRVG